MKEWIYNIMTILFAGAIMFACSEEEVLIEDGTGTVEKDRPVALTLSVQDITPTIVETRATEAEEKLLNDLQVFVFDANGNLKGYTMVSGSNKLAQDGKVGTVSVNTRTGQSYIYAVANHSTNIYKADLDLPQNLNADNAQNGEVEYTLADFKKKVFNREAGEITIAEAGFLMSGAANNGNLCTIARNTDGTAYISDPTTDDNKIIKLKRVVSKVTFNISAAGGKRFTPTKYDIMNIPLKGSLIAGGTFQGVTYENEKGIIFNPNTPNSFEIYLPENLQMAENNIEKWDDREANTYANGTKVFTNAPADATYVVVYGVYEDESNKITGDVNYTVHLGDFTSDYDNFKNERNYRYTYNLEIQGVDKIKAEAELNTQEEWQPGAEGFVLNYNSGQAFTLDSHYESRVMRFTYEEIYNLKHNETSESKGYVYQVRTHQGETDVEMITNQTEFDDSKLNGVDISWIEFYQGADGDRPLTYTATKDRTKYGIRELLVYLYSIADEDKKSLWTNGEYLDFTCFVSENYYEDLSWGTYVNVEPRSFSIANNVYVSTDRMSVYADVKYNVSQYAIQTFYNRDKDGSIVAFGCETINDEEEIVNGVQRGTTMKAENNVGNHTSTDKATNGIYTWHGRDLTKKDMAWSKNSSWPYQKSLEEFHMACMARNRDLNKNGKVDDDEIRWYTPSLPQATGLWIGEEAIATNARLYNKSMEGVEFRTVTITANSNGKVRSISTGDLKNHMHYYTSTNPQRVFWAEEGMAFGSGVSSINYIRCVRTLKSNDVGYSAEPDKYYSYSNYEFKLENVDASALRTSTTDKELIQHNEREELNRARIEFKLSKDGVTQVSPTANVDNKQYSYFNLQTIQTASGNASPCSQYKEEGGNWRIPNQREFALMILEGTLSSDSAPYYACRTGYSGNHRYGYRFASSNLAMIEPDKLSYPNHISQFEDYWGWNQYNTGTASDDNTNGTQDRYRVRCVTDY